MALWSLHHFATCYAVLEMKTGSCRRYLGLYKDEVEAAKAYDREAVMRRGIHAVTNFDLSEYMDLLGMHLTLSPLSCSLS